MQTGPKNQTKTKRLASRPSKADGFTLIELLVVISIISFLASLILVSVNGARLKARDSQRTTNVSQMQTALDLYYSDHNAYPSGTYYSGWDTGNYSGSDAKCWCESTSTNGSLEQALVMGDYISKLPQDPLPAEGDGNYLSDAQGKGYLYVSDGQDYVIGTYLESTNVAPPIGNATSSCSAAGNYQVSTGSLNPSLCPVPYVPGDGGGPPSQQTTPVITTGTFLPGAQQNSYYSTTLQANETGTWALSSGSLPQGLSLSSGGVISGSSSAGGTYFFGVRFTDSNNATATQSFRLTVTLNGNGTN